MIFVTGCARSGTSLITKILQAHGCSLGPENRVNSLYENIGVREMILKPYLSSIGVDPLGQKKLPDTNNLPDIPDLKRHISNFIYGKEPFAYKDAKLTLVWPAFHREYPDAKWVVVRREKQTIINSCLHTPFMRASKDEKFWSNWVDEHIWRFDDMRGQLNMIEIWTDMLMDNVSAFEPVAEFCGLTFDAKAVKKAIDKSKWHRST